MDRQQENNDQQKSSVDRVNDLINKGQSARKNYKRGRAAGQAGKMAGRMAVQAGRQVVVAAGEAIVSTAPVWGIPALILLIIIIVVIIIFGGGQNTTGVVEGDCGGISTSSLDATPANPTTLTAVNCKNVQPPLTYKWTSSDTAGNLSNPTGETTIYTPSSATIKDVTIVLTICNATNALECSTDSVIINGTTLSNCTLDYTQYPAECLKQVFNVVVKNESNKSRLITIYKIFASTNSDTYKNLLRKGGNVLYIDVPYCTSDCISVTSANNIKLSGFFSSGLSYNSQRYLLIHESGHVITGRNRQLSDSFDNNRYANMDGTACYQYNSTYCTKSFRGGNFVRSYSLRYYCDRTCWTDISAQHEAFAEAIANYAVGTRNTYYRCSIPILDVKSQCPNTNAWIKNNIYGGVVF
nr:hypothetical protein [Candidatus Levybacteria bacterium]